MDFGLRFIIGLCALAFLGTAAYNLWKSRYYRRPHLIRTEVSLQIDEDVIYFPQIVSVCEEYVHSSLLLVAGAAWGFLVHILVFFFMDLRLESFNANIASAVAFTFLGGLAGFGLSLSKKTVVRDSSGNVHVLHLPEVETVKFRRELTKDIWHYYKKFTKVKPRKNANS